MQDYIHTLLNRQKVGCQDAPQWPSRGGRTQTCAALGNEIPNVQEKQYILEAFLPKAPLTEFSGVI